MREYPYNQRRRPSGGDDLERATTLRAVFEVHVEHAHGHAQPDTTRHDRRTQSGIEGEHPMKMNPMQARARRQRGQALAALLSC